MSNTPSLDLQSHWVSIKEFEPPTDLMRSKSTPHRIVGEIVTKNHLFTVVSIEPVFDLSPSKNFVSVTVIHSTGLSRSSVSVQDMNESLLRLGEQ